MKQLLILRWKGGTGKTTIADAFIRLISQVYATAMSTRRTSILSCVIRGTAADILLGLTKAVLIRACATLRSSIMNCRFEAINAEPSYRLTLRPVKAAVFCVAFARRCVTLNPAAAGELMLYSGGGEVFPPLS
jgi:MinD superfamily P-loop ATPase